ncbi:tRNA pseudouridine(55) synthase TruB [Chlorobium sp. N1]|uniref:tRNA pseudouridine(55) synthase TruB n=1 Tax=Chlorobium sp. N1 TaxID=2491138 RepID=UPI0010405068|nr:tRNA pseudouridine(55) synthase TruB [Chlorobium sp. N1]TCD48904.1 tRNA pseudouridine(55) synthase TruB [Chlorobium sp. N1]
MEVLHTETPGVPEAGEFLLVDKPLDWTSFDVVAKIRNTYKRGGLKRKVGHCGTLDPKATGLLILATGRRTKEISSLEGLDKEYLATIKLGAETPSHDVETEECRQTPVDHLSEADVRRVAASFVGPRLQQPPMHSAVWHEGRRLYEMARRGEEVKERKARPIVIHSFEVERVELPFVHCRLVVSKGAYIRVIAHELGRELGVGGYLAGLRRTAIGPYRVEDAMRVAEAMERIERQTAFDAEAGGHEE